ncbi:L28 family ribosomal protein [Candidatus Vidania fulgoroideorum]
MLFVFKKPMFGNKLSKSKRKNKKKFKINKKKKKIIFLNRTLFLKISNKDFRTFNKWQKKKKK